jgi:hypothetical protein
LATLCGCDHAERADSSKPILSVDADHFFALKPYAALYLSGSEPPEVAEREDWLKYRRDADGMVKTFLNPQYFDYSYDELETWSARGDPVAMYLEAYALYNQNGCAEAPNIRNLLEAAYRVNSGVTYRYLDRDYPEKRVPEAALALKNLVGACPAAMRGSSVEVYQKMADEGGVSHYDLKIPREE